MMILPAALGARALRFVEYAKDMNLYTASWAGAYGECTHDNLYLEPKPWEQETE